MPEAGWIRSAGGVVLRPQEVLLIRVSDIKVGLSVVPFRRGGWMPEKLPHKTAVREVMEETGWCCRIEADLSTTNYWFQQEGRRFP